ncbi:hypothetical protein ACIBEJ_48785 [Nonomuraea sp. NPDC050790]|uniref:hypothetical protein n=1 Tax=Nonomuraea sp. NPDC050790 TaxID=3364371 RepID=UPI00378F282E
MTDIQLAALAEHYAKTVHIDFTVGSRVDHPFGLGDEQPTMTAADIQDGYIALTEQIHEHDGKTIEVNGFVDIIREDGTETMIPIDRIALDDIESAQVCLAAQFHALYAESHAILTTFAGLDRMKKHLTAQAGA